MKIVLDTNVFISGIFWDGNFCSKIINKWKKKKLNMITSIPIINELTETLKNFKIQIDEEIIKEWQKIILENSIVVNPSEKINIIKEDADDNKFIEAALAGNVDYIISQDKHLLKIKEYDKIKIISPEEFLKIILI